MLAMFVIFYIFYKISSVLNATNVNNTTILVGSEDTLPIREYEDFILESYKQHFIEPVENFLSIDTDLDSTLRIVVIETNDTFNDLTKYRLMIKGIKETNLYFITAIVDLNIVDGKNLRIYIDNIKPITIKHASFDLSKQVMKCIKKKKEEMIIRIRCNDRCPESMQPILTIKTEISQNSRQKREIRNDDDCANKGCCLKKRYFHSQNSGLNYKTAPERFAIDFCEGKCNQALVPATNDRNLLVQAMRNSLQNSNPFQDKWVCCVPINFTSVNIAEQYDNGTQRSIKFKDAKVTECGCVI
uniref:TGF_BETA_2 domain-containing protein n=1 Tax=Onchocerca volvulus TaxID=6282 RepID=A0A8R1XZ10_ONCVO